MPDYRSGAGLAMGLTMLGGGIGSALERKRRRKQLETENKAREELIKALTKGESIANWSTPASNLAQVMAKTSGALPMGLGPAAQMQAAFLGKQAPLLKAEEDAVASQNAALQKIREAGLSGVPEAQQWALQKLLGEEEDKGAWQSAGNGFIYNTKTAEFMQMPGYDGPKGPIILPQNSTLIDPTTREVLYTSSQPNTVLKPRDVSTVGQGGRTETKTVYDVIDMDKLKLVDTIETPGTTWKEPSKGGLNVTLPDGTVISQYGEDVGLIGGKTTRSKIEDDMYDAQKGLDRIDSILSSIDDSYLVAPKQWQNWWRDKKERAGLSLSEGAARELAGYSTFKQYTLSNLNLYIKEITGAQMGETEAQRLMEAMPKMDDGKTVFRAKAAAIQRSLKASHKKYWEVLTATGDKAKAQRAADEASVDAYYAVPGGNKASVPPVSAAPEAPPGYTWQVREDGVNALVRAD